MSSHHIVREKQEPALLLAGLNNFDDELLGQLLEWSPTVVATAATAEKVEARGIKIDWLVSNGPVDIQQSDIKLLTADGGDAIVAALDHLTAGGYPAVNLIVDKFDISTYTKYFNQIDLIIFCEEKKIVAVRPGFSKWKPAGERIEFLTVPHNFLYTGLSAVVNSVYETTGDGFFSLQFSDDLVCMAEWM